MKILYLLLILLLNGNNNTIIFSSTKWDIGTVTENKILQKEINISNMSNRPVTISFVSTCGCLEVSREHIEIKAGGKGSITFFFDPKDESGKIEKYIIIRSNFKGLKKAIFPVTGYVKIPGSTAAATESIKKEVGKNEINSITFSYYYSPGCRSCLKFLNNEIPLIEKKLDINIDIERLNILDPNIYRSYLNTLHTLGMREQAFPSIIIGKKVLQGEKEIDRNIEKTIEDFISANIEKSKGRNKVPQSLKGSQISVSMGRISIFPVLTAGLLDGVNPCAFTTLIFLLASLALAGRTRREIMILGICFALAVFVTYYLIGIGVFKFLRLTTIFPVISNVIRWILIAVLLTFAILSLYDFYLFKIGKTKKMILQLPSYFKRQIHKSVKEHTRSAALIASALTLGVLVSLFELACTGQVYLPTIVYLIRVDRDITGYLLLFLYNIGFIIPLLAVFILAYSGISSKKITLYFQKSIGLVKLSFFFLFIGLAVLTFIT